MFVFVFVFVLVFVFVYSFSNHLRLHLSPYSWPSTCLSPPSSPATYVCVCVQLDTAQGTVDKKYSHLKAFAHVDVVDVEKCELPSRSKAQEEKEKMHSFSLLS